MDVSHDRNSIGTKKIPKGIVTSAHLCHPLGKELLPLLVIKGNRHFEALSTAAMPSQQAPPHTTYEQEDDNRDGWGILGLVRVK